MPEALHPFQRTSHGTAKRGSKDPTVPVGIDLRCNWRLFPMEPRVAVKEHDMTTARDTCGDDDRLYTSH